MDHSATTRPDGVGVDGVLARAAVAVWVAATAAAAVALPVGAQAAPPSGLPRQITIVVPFSPGGSNDLFARAIGQRLARKFNVTVIVDNKPGAGGAIGSDMVARAEPDGSRCC